MAKRIFKSKKKLSSVKAVYRKWSEWDVGDILIGTFKGTQIDQYEKDNYLIEVEDAQFGNKKAAKKLAAVDGEKVIIGLNHTGKLGRAMKNAEVGDVIQITYNGMDEMAKGKFKGKDAHDMEVEVVEEEDEDESEDEDDESDSDDSDDETEDDDEDDDL